ncbi:MAG: class I SAM-dependent methyltransferase [Pirellulales bacterium]|nr:class I SAM-dependent methyltransferase [Pirellulales bacterium]
MDPLKPPEARQLDDWDRIYREGLPPWETGVPARELVRLLGEQADLVPKGTAIELGCGTGADAVYLAKAGFDVTAVEISPIALERARARARLENAAVHFVLGDIFDCPETAGKYDLIYDAGFYEFARRKKLSRFLDLLWRMTAPGSFYLTLVGNTDDSDENSPPGVTQDEIHLELGRLFEMVQLRSIRLESPRHAAGYPGWSCLMRRPEPVTG